VALFHQLRVTRTPALELVDALEPAEVPLLLLHAVSWPLLRHRYGDDDGFR
jgi:hypothetical protein